MRLALATATACFVFAVFYPTHFLNADEIAYFEQAFIWVNGKTTQFQYFPCHVGTGIPVRAGDYPFGTALLAGFLIKLGGAKAAFWTGTASWMTGVWAIALALQHSGKPVIWALYPWLFFPAMVLMRTVMSDVPSFGMAAVFLSLYLPGSSRPKSMFPAGLIAGSALLFRETNLLWAVPFLAGAFIRRQRGAGRLWAGFAAGAALRLLSGWAIHGNPWYFKDPGIAYSLSFFTQHLAFYLLVLTIILPGGLWFLWRSNWQFRNEVFAAVLLFLLLYSVYGYDAFTKSGIKGLFLQGRFMLPLLPFITHAAAHGNTRLHVLFFRFRIPLLCFAGFGYCASHMAAWRYNRDQDRFTEVLYALPTAGHVSFHFDETRKYINALHGPANVCDATLQPAPEFTCDSIWYVHLISRDDSVDRRNKAATDIRRLHEAFGDSLPLPVQDLRLIDGTRLRVWKLWPKGQARHSSN